MPFGQFLSTIQFYLYGRRNCTRTGWEKAVKNYAKPDLLDSTTLDLTGKVYLITGANAGIGREITSYLAKHNATVYMVCRNRERAEQSRQSILQECTTPTSSPNAEDRLRLLIGDCSLETDVRRVWSEFMTAETNASIPRPRLDGLICNAGALLNKKTLTSEGVEVTFGAHLLYGVYLLGKLALESGVLPGTEDSRLIVVSSGGMYNTKFPSWDIATSLSTTNRYNGQFAYAYAKRGQVLLCERWAEKYPTVKIVSCHPGWTLSEGVEAAYGDKKKYLEPLRNLWQGAEGIIWLAVTPSTRIESGAFYLDRSPQVKHMAGLFFSEGSFTKNTKEEVDEMMNKLEKWSLKETREIDQANYEKESSAKQ